MQYLWMWFPKAQRLLTIYSDSLEFRSGNIGSCGKVSRRLRHDWFILQAINILTDQNVIWFISNLNISYCLSPMILIWLCRRMNQQHVCIYYSTQIVPGYLFVLFEKPTYLNRFIRFSSMSRPAYPVPIFLSFDRSKLSHSQGRLLQQPGLWLARHSLR